MIQAKLGLFKVNNKPEKIYFIAKFYFGARTGTQKTGAQNQSVHPIKKQLETLLFFLIQIGVVVLIFKVFQLLVFATKLL